MTEGLPAAHLQGPQVSPGPHARHPPAQGLTRRTSPWNCRSARAPQASLRPCPCPCPLPASEAEQGHVWDRLGFPLSTQYISFPCLKKFNTTRSALLFFFLGKSSFYGFLKLAGLASPPRTAALPQPLGNPCWFYPLSGRARAPALPEVFGQSQYVPPNPQGSCTGLRPLSEGLGRRPSCLGSSVTKGGGCGAADTLLTRTGGRSACAKGSGQVPTRCSLPWMPGWSGGGPPPPPRCQNARGEAGGQGAPLPCPRGLSPTDMVPSARVLSEAPTQMCGSLRSLPGSAGQLAGGRGRSLPKRS